MSLQPWGPAWCPDGVEIPGRWRCYQQCVQCDGRKASAREVGGDNGRRRGTVFLVCGSRSRRAPVGQWDQKSSTEEYSRYGKSGTAAAVLFRCGGC